jgi:hypothetical protein
MPEKINPNQNSEGPIRVPGYDEISLEKESTITDAFIEREDEDGVIITVLTNQMSSKGLPELRTLWHPGGLIFETLRRKGFIDADGTNLRHFRMEEVRTKIAPDPGGNYETKFHYRLIEDELI